MERVLPGVELVFATFFLLNRELIKEDFPTLERPHNITSGSLILGSCSISKTDFTNLISFINRNIYEIIT